MILKNSPDLIKAFRNKRKTAYDNTYPLEGIFSFIKEESSFVCCSADKEVFNVTVWNALKKKSN